MTAADTVHGVPRMTGVQARVHLATLALTEDGDVFYTVIQPGIVWRRNQAGGTGEFIFQAVGSEQWYTADAMGAPGERVVVIHNTKKYCADPAGEC